VLKQIAAMTWKELKIYLKDPAVWAWMFLQPFVLIVVLSFAMGGGSGDDSPQVPDSFQQNTSGVTIYGILWIVSLLAGSVYQEKREGTFRRLLVAPMRRSVMLAGKLLPYYLINLLQIIVMLGLSRLLFGIELGTSPAGLVLVSLAAAATATGLGVLVAALARTDAQVGAISTILLITLAVLGGCFVPRWVMPEWLQTLGLLTPHAWAVDAYQALMVQGAGLADVLPAVAVLAAFAALFFGVGVWRFRFE
jgi:ABC-2 type transport system permease protein